MLTARGAFLVQIDDSTDLAGKRLDGRVEHVLTGRTFAFESGGDLLAFIAEALRGSATPKEDDP